MFGYSPLWLLSIAVQLFFGIHAVRSGRFGWLFIILFFPGLGCLIYFIAEYLPEIKESRRTRRVAGRVAETFVNTLDPGKKLRELEARYRLTQSFANRNGLAQAYLEVGRVDEAITLFNENTQGVHAGDPATMRGLAHAWYAKNDLVKTREYILLWRAKKESTLAGEMDMLYARVLEKSGDLGGAVAEYDSLAKRAGSEEARYRAGILLKGMGRLEEARVRFKEIVTNAEMMSASYRKVHRAWIDLAKKEL